MPKPTIAFKPAAGAAVLLLATAPGAWADLQATTIWEDWQEVYNRFGGTLGSEGLEYSGGVLTLTGVNYRTEFGGAVSTATYGDIVMTEQDDGSVTIEVPSESRSETTSEDSGVTVDQVMVMQHDGLSIVAREDGAERVYDIAANGMTIDVETVIQGAGDETPPPNMVKIALGALESVYRSGLGTDGQGFAQTFSTDTVTLETEFDDGTNGMVTFSYVLDGVASDASGSYGEQPDGPIEGLSDMGLIYAGDMTHSGSTLAIAGTTPDGPLEMNGTSESGAITFEVGEETLGYGLTSTGGDITAQLPGFPLPVNVSMAEVASAFTFPMGEPGTEKPFGLQMALKDLVVDDALWGLFDPTAQLPRDPATLVIDMDGSAVMNVDIFGDPDAFAELQGAPGVLKGVTLNELLLTVAGAELRGSGDLDFPNETPIPEPVGTINLALDGGFGLVDKLVALGFVPAEQAAFVKGMAGAVAKPVGEDQLESTIEFTEGGGISANGLPLK
ncbi:DUF2125 domain-containing protein [Jannaschia marina]|uniref:DUF2125 domain-containing protein n=1 Tax=Jannaschia marina TaxID=2741674 RepID=UPI0015C9FB21|nr:DUF2125 domain-containing protein [Jannaschia marina]